MAPLDVHVTLDDGTEYPVKVDNLGNGLLVEFPQKLKVLEVNVALCGRVLHSGILVFKLLSCYK